MRYDNDQLRYLIMLHSKQALEQMDQVPEGIDGLPFEQARMIEGALQTNQLNASEIIKKIENVSIVYMDTILDTETLTRLRQIGFSRVPISFTSDKTATFGILLTKSLVGYEACNETIKEALINDHIRVIVPMFFTESTNLGDICRAFREGQCHMGVICESAEAAKTNRDFADNVMQNMTKGKDYIASTAELNLLAKQTVLGVITLENVLERIFQMEIKDEMEIYRIKVPEPVVSLKMNQKTPQ